VTNVIVVSGRRNSGKTTWVCALAATLRERGLRVGSLKHTHHDCLPPGKDSTRHLEAGAARVVLVTPTGAIRYESWDEEPTLDRLLRTEFAGFDLVLVEGYRAEKAPRLIVGDDPEADTTHLLRRVPEAPALTRALVAEVADLILAAIGGDHGDRAFPPG